MRGWLRQISPDESLHALIFQVASRIDKGATIDELHAWAGVFLSIPTKYVQLANEKEGFWRANRIRDKIGNDYEFLTLTPTQRSVQLYNFKEKQKKATGKELTNEDVAKQFQAKLNAPMTVASGDQMCKSLVDSALGVYSRVLIYKDCNDMVNRMASLNGKKTPYDSMYKLEVYPKRPTTT